jgi:IS30 family transposase
MPQLSFSTDKITGGSVQAAPRTSLWRVILDDNEGRNARIHRNTGAGGETASQVKQRVYFDVPKQADELAQERKQQRASARITAAQWARVESLLRQEWSPEQIAGRLVLEQQARVSHERIYQYVYANKAAGGTL